MTIVIAFFAMVAGSVAQAQICIPTTPTSDFVDNGDGTVTHSKTKLMWKKCTEGQSAPSCTPSSGASFLNWGDAQIAAAQTYAGYTNWRLPNSKELESIVEECQHGATINPTVFPNTPGSRYWSSTSGVSGNTAWGTSFSNGADFTDAKVNHAYVRAVRDGDPPARHDMLEVLTLPTFNDTNIDLAYDSASNSFVFCTAAVVGDGTTNPRQNCEFGLHALAASGVTIGTGIGGGGNSFWKIAADGTVLASTATDYAGIYDEHSGLLWMVQTSTSGLLDAASKFSWWNSDPATNGGNAGTANGGTCDVAGQCDTEKLIAGANDAMVCGVNGWGLPLAIEVEGSLCNFNGSSPAIDPALFPNLRIGSYWTNNRFGTAATLVVTISSSNCQTAASATSTPNYALLVARVGRRTPVVGQKLVR